VSHAGNGEWESFYVIVGGAAGACNVCRELEEKMARAQRVLRAISDDLTTERLEALICDYEEKLRTLVCPDKRKPAG
jgi:hypothetical protein